MYNIHQYNALVQSQQKVRENQQKYAKYLLKHEDYKEKASTKVKEKAQQFVHEQHDSPMHFVFEDDHFARWRPHRQYRDIEDHTKFLSFKSFRHKPHYQMDKYFNERQRKQINELSAKKEHLVKSNVIPEEQRGRSLRCQGPLCPKIEFRQKKKDHEYLQPRLRFGNVTDRQRINQSAMSYDNKFKEVYNTFSLSKSKIGRTTISPNRNRYKDRSETKDALDFIDDTNSEMAKSKPFYFQKEPEMDSPVPSLSYTGKIPNPETDRLSSNSYNGSGKIKTYFKLAKTLHLFSPKQEIKDKIQTLLKKSQFQRTKDMTNIRFNMRGQNFTKRPIL